VQPNLLGRRAQFSCWSVQPLIDLQWCRPFTCYDGDIASRNEPDVKKRSSCLSRSQMIFVIRTMH